jgi:hypothetical protein
MIFIEHIKSWEYFFGVNESHFQIIEWLHFISMDILIEESKHSTEGSPFRNVFQSKANVYAI